MFRELFTNWKRRRALCLVGFLLIGSTLFIIIGKFLNQVLSRPDVKTESSNHVKSPPHQAVTHRAQGASVKTNSSIDDNELSNLNATQVDTSLLAADGQISPLALKTLKLSHSEQLKFKKMSADLRARIANIARKKLIVDAARSDESKGINAYLIPAFPEEGQEALSTFFADCTVAFGEQRSQLIRLMFPKNAYYGGFGTRDVSVLFQEREPSPIFNPIKLTLIESDPKSGSKILERSGDLETTGRYLPDIFAVVQK